MTSFERIMSDVEPRHALGKHLAFLTETEDCRALLAWLVDFIDTVRVLEDGRLEARMTAAQRMLRISPPETNNEVEEEELASLREVWAHAGRLDVSTLSGVDPISLLGVTDAGTWADSDDYLFDGCDIRPDLRGVVDQLYDEKGPRRGGTSPIQQAQSAHIGPWFVLDGGTQTSRGEPVLRRVSRNRGKPNYLIGPVLSTELGVGASFLRIVASYVLGVPDDIAFGSYAALRETVDAGSSRFLIHRGEKSAAHIRVADGIAGDQVHVWEGGFSEQGKTRWVKPLDGLDVVEQAKRESGGYVERGYVDLAAASGQPEASTAPRSTTATKMTKAPTANPTKPEPSKSAKPAKPTNAPKSVPTSKAPKPKVSKSKVSKSKVPRLTKPSKPTKLKAPKPSKSLKASKAPQAKASRQARAVKVAAKASKGRRR